MDTVLEVFRYLLIFLAAMFGLLIILIVTVSLLPPDNPLKRILVALSYRVAATLAVGTVALPIEFVPGLDLAYDIAAPVALVWFWYTFFRNAYRDRGVPRPAATPHATVDLKRKAQGKLTYEP